MQKRSPVLTGERSEVLADSGFPDPTQYADVKVSPPVALTSPAMTALSTL